MSMFGSNGKAETASKSGQSLNSTNQFVEGTIINGDIRAANDMRIDGTVIGTLQSNAKLVLGAKGIIEGDIQCDNADISGSIKGKLQIKELLLLKSTANVEGDIIANKVVVEAGAKFNGTCSMGAQSLSNEEKRGTSSQKEAV